MRQFLIAFMGPDGRIHEIKVDATEKALAYQKARENVSRYAGDDLRLFRFEEGTLGPHGWSKYYDVTL